MPLLLDPGFQKYSEPNRLNPAEPHTDPHPLSRRYLNPARQPIAHDRADKFLRNDEEHSNRTRAANAPRRWRHSWACIGPTRLAGALGAVRVAV